MPEPKSPTASSKKPKLLAAGHPDNFQTPASALDCLVPHINMTHLWRVWEPACGKGNLVKGLEAKGFVVYGSDILTGHDFLTTERHGTYDIIISNPPFSIKEKFLARCYELGKPFALLMPITTFDSHERRKLFHRHGIQLILPDGRINFETPNRKGSSAWFYCNWWCWGLNLPYQLNFAGMQAELV
jgi:hypothetical protein